MSEIVLPDIRVVSVIHDNDNDSLRVSWDSEEISPYEALGIVMAGAFKHLVELSDVDVNVDDDGEYPYEEDDDDA